MTELEQVGERWEYAPAPESREIVQLQERYGHYIGGKWLEATETYTTIAPSTEEPLAEVGQGTAADVDAAVAAAREAFPVWGALRPAERAKYLFRIARILQERSRELAVLES
ncbi:MAG: aldehyde dehydrogenase family protein, partial [Gaiellaceae bacterium]